MSVPSQGSGPALVGLDLGTTNTKAAVLDPTSGKVVAVTSRPTPYVDVAPDVREIDPSQWWEVTADCLRTVIVDAQRPIVAVGIASMAEAGVPLDAVGCPLYNIIPWYDPRTEPQLQQVLARIGPKRLFEITGQATRNVYTLFKILWLREHAPHVIANLWRWLSVADYIAWQLTGVTATDYTLASRTMLLDQRTRTWSNELLAVAGVRADQLPSLALSGDIVGRVTRKAAIETGLPAGAGVAICGHDHLCGALAVGAVHPGQVADSIGTAESMVIPVGHYVDDDRLRVSRTCCYAHVAGSYVIQAGMAMSGGGLDWLAHRLFAERPEPVEAALAEAQRVPLGAETLFYFPYLGGNGAPLGDENVTACFVGLRPVHDRAHLVRALLEGIAYAMRDALDVVSKVIGPPVPPILAFGGGSRSPFWLQIRANVLGLPVLGVEVPEAVALGAALLAGVGAGRFPNAAAATAIVPRIGTWYEPDPAEHARYEPLFRDGYRSLYPALKPVFATVARLRHFGGDD
jgi:xylulokinase